MTSDLPIDPKQPPRNQSISIDALADDLFGLNWRAIKTLGASFANPRQYSEAAWNADWRNLFTPSFRLWFTLVAILLFFQFFWADADGAIIALYTTQMEASAVSLPDGVTTQDASLYFARVNFTVLPFASAFCMFVFGSLYRVWGEVVPLVVRVRYVFAVSVPSTALALPIFWMLGIVSPAEAKTFIVLSWLIPIPIDLWIAYRGVFSRLKGLARFWRSSVLAVGLFATLMTSALISSVIAGAWITLRHSA